VPEVVTTQIRFDSILIPTTTIGLLREARLGADLARSILHGVSWKASTDHPTSKHGSGESAPR
jgi:hypothetical protein